MEFSTIAFVLLGVGLPVFYLAMIIHDIYFVKDAEELMPKPEEVEVDISDEAGQFQPIFIDKDAAPKTAKPVQEVKAEQPEQANTADQPKEANAAGQPVVSAPKEKGKNEAENKEKNKDKEKTDEDDNDKAKTSAVQPDNVLEPVVADKEARKRIQELVRIRRQQMHAEELAAAKKKASNSRRLSWRRKNTKLKILQHLLPLSSISQLMMTTLPKLHHPSPCQPKSSDPSLPTSITRQKSRRRTPSIAVVRLPRSSVRKSSGSLPTRWS